MTTTAKARKKPQRRSKAVTAKPGKTFLEIDSPSRERLRVNFPPHVQVRVFKGD